MSYERFLLELAAFGLLFFFLGMVCGLTVGWMV